MSNGIILKEKKMTFQYDFFDPIDPLENIKSSQKEIKESLRKTQRRFFAQNKELMTIIIKQQKEIDNLNNRITNLTKVKCE